MKKSELKKYIRENIISTLSEDTEAEIEKTKELTSAIKDLETAKKEAGIEENGGSLKEDSFDELKKYQKMLSDAADFYRKKAEELGVGDIRAFNKGINDLETAIFDEDNKRSGGKIDENEKTANSSDDVIDPADYGVIGQNYLAGFGRENTLDLDNLEKLGRKIVAQIFKGNFEKAKAKFIKEDLKEVENIGLADLEEMGYNEADDFFETKVKPHINSKIDFRYFQKGLMQGLSDAVGSYGLNENEEEVFNPDAKVKKTKGLAKAKEELALLTREMKSLAKKYSKAEGEDKEKLVKILKDKTKLKKELESILDNKKI